MVNNTLAFDALRSLFVDIIHVNYGIIAYYIRWVGSLAVLYS